MRAFHLRFALDEEGRRPREALIDLLEENAEHKPPATGGAYVIGTADTMLIYPWGTSPVFYIGQTANLRQRLAGHKTMIQEAREDYDHWYRPRHQYGAALGAHVAWYSRRGPESPRVIEGRLMDAFYELFGAIPCANGAWSRGHTTRPAREDDESVNGHG